MGIELIDERLCDGCAVCIDSCPMDVLRMDQAKDKAYIAYPGDCQCCFLCETDCHTDAIYVSFRRMKETPFPW